MEEMGSHNYPYTFRTTRKVPPTLVYMYSPVLYDCNSQAMTHVVPGKTSQPPSPHPLPLQEEEVEVAESKEVDQGASVDICGSSTTAYRCIDIKVRMTRSKMCSPLFVTMIQCVLLNRRLPFATTDHSHGFIFVLSGEPIVKLFDPFNLLDCKVEGIIKLRNDCHLAVMAELNCPNVLRSLHQCTYIALQSVSDEVHISYMSIHEQGR